MSSSSLSKCRLSRSTHGSSSICRRSGDCTPRSGSNTPPPQNLSSAPSKLQRCSTPVAGSTISWLSQLDINDSCSSTVTRKTGIICTIGPASNSISMMCSLRKAGMNVVRMNFSHGDHEYHRSIINNLRSSFVEEPLGDNVAVALDTKGPEIRIGDFRSDYIDLVKGENIILSIDEKWKSCGDNERIYVDYAELAESVSVGSMVYVDDGCLQLCVKQVYGKDGDDDASCKLCLEKGEVVVQAVNSHRLYPRKGVNLPFCKVNLPSITEKDRKDLLFGVSEGVDIVFASFIRSAADIQAIRSVLGHAGAFIKIIAKIENYEGLENFDEILEASDGIMVARGDLGIEIPAEKVFVAQKMMIARCNLMGKPVICATQMLESMKGNPRPTRAEASDVANAVLDGADCVMLSAETASGAYPCQSVRVMSDVCREAEATIAYLPLFEELRTLIGCREGITETIACSAVNASLEALVSAIVVLTTTGTTARLVAKFRPEVPIITVTRCAQTARQIHLHRGCYPFLYCDHNDKDSVDDCDAGHDHNQSDVQKTALENKEEWQADVENRFKWGLEQAIKQGLVAKGDYVVLIQGEQAGHGHTNTMRIVPV